MSSEGSWGLLAFTLISPVRERVDDWLSSISLGVGWLRYVTPAFIAPSVSAGVVNGGALIESGTRASARDLTGNASPPTLRCECCSVKRPGRRAASEAVVLPKIFRLQKILRQQVTLRQN